MMQIQNQIAVHESLHNLFSFFLSSLFLLLARNLNNNSVSIFSVYVFFPHSFVVFNQYRNFEINQYIFNSNIKICVHCNRYIYIFIYHFSHQHTSLTCLFYSIDCIMIVPFIQYLAICKNKINQCSILWHFHTIRPYVCVKCLL